MNGKHSNCHKSSEVYQKHHSSTTNGFRSSSDAIKNITNTDSHRNRKGSKSSSFNLSELKKNPDAFNKLLDTAIQIERQQSNSTTIEMNFAIRYNTSFGERIVVTGMPDFFGNWDPVKGLELEWSSGNIWRANILLSEGNLKDFEYKYVCMKDPIAEWEVGNNRKFKVADGVFRGQNLVFTCNDSWRDHSD